MVESELIKALKVLSPDLEIQKNPYSRYDCSTDRSIIEVKCRKTHYDTLLIEKSKYDALMLESEKQNKLPIYIVNTPKGTWVFNLLDLTHPHWETKYLPSTTQFGGGNRNKEIGYLHISTGRKIPNI